MVQSRHHLILPSTIGLDSHHVFLIVQLRFLYVLWHHHWFDLSSSIQNNTVSMSCCFSSPELSCFCANLRGAAYVHALVEYALLSPFLQFLFLRVFSSSRPPSDTSFSILTSSLALLASVIYGFRFHVLIELSIRLLTWSNYSISSITVSAVTAYDLRQVISSQA